jgi:hypothetical protein
MTNPFVWQMYQLSRRLGEIIDEVNSAIDQRGRFAPIGEALRNPDDLAFLAGLDNPFMHEVAPMLIPQITRLKNVFLSGDAKLGDLLYNAKSLNDRLYNELKRSAFFWMRPDLATYYGHRALFGQTVNDKFPKCVEDIRNAGNCYALEQPTACVLHLMRAMEAAIARLNKRLLLKNRPKATWGSMLKDMDGAISRMPEATTRQKRKKDAWSEARVNLYHVAHAWRNPGMHSRQTYTSTQAKEIVEAVKVFMVSLAQL